jgi:hypothetical protein
MTDSQFNFKDGSRRQAACNEPVKDYAPGSTERTQIKAQLAQMLTERIELPLVIGGEHVRTGLLEPAIVPHDHAHVLALGRAKAHRRCHRCCPASVAGVVSNPLAGAGCDFPKGGGFAFWSTA